MLPALAVAIAYLVGSIPFGYLIPKIVRGIDIRAMGSGNVGATNVGRVMGLRWFFVVFALDLAKGMIPTWGLPRWAGPGLAWLPVVVALATIVGHNFPAFLGFRGGKGVATSLGSLAVLDPAAAAATATTFVVFLLVTRIVSLSSLAGGLVFVLLHLGQGRDPFGRGRIADSLIVIGLLGMLIVRHRKNLGRIAAGTEPKVRFRKARPRAGSARVAAVVGVLVVGGIAAAVGANASRKGVLDLPPLRLEEVARVATGHQRAERIVFADGGRVLAVLCPRYQRLVLYRADRSRGLTTLRDVPLDGRPVAVAASGDRLLVLQRPHADARHVEAGWWDAFDLSGRPVGSRFRVGFDPDDLAIAPDGRSAVVLLSGKAEGESNRPDPELIVVDLAGAVPAVAGRLTFATPGDDPDRVTLSHSGRHAAVTLLGSEAVAAVDLADPAHPRLIGRAPLSGRDVPTLSRGEGDAILMPAAGEGEAVLVPGSGGEPYLIRTLPGGSALEVVHAERRRPLGRLALRGPANLGSVRPTGLAFSAEAGLLAVANRSGGVHLIEIKAQHPGPALAATAGAARR